VNSRSPVAIVE